MLSLKKGGKPFIREPTGESHGMAAEEVRAIMASNGLRQANSATGKGPQGWPTYQGVQAKQEIFGE
jgi:hypothetical protein